MEDPSNNVGPDNPSPIMPVIVFVTAILPIVVIYIVGKILF